MIKYSYFKRSEDEAHSRVEDRVLDKAHSRIEDGAFVLCTTDVQLAFALCTTDIYLHSSYGQLQTELM